MALKKPNNSKYTIHQKDPKKEMIQWKKFNLQNNKKPISIINKYLEKI